MTITAQVPGPRKREETTISTRFCRALGACVLTTGLAFGGAGGAIASADDAGDTAASTTSDTSGPDTSSPDTATAGTPSLRQSVQNAVHDLTADGTAGLNPQQDRVAQAADDPADKDAADVKPGDQVEVLIDRIENENGMIGLSKNKADMMKADSARIADSIAAAGKGKKK